jgi:hypothetical protein
VTPEQRTDWRRAVEDDYRVPGEPELDRLTGDLAEILEPRLG